jgi:hypothetical protein
MRVYEKGKEPEEASKQIVCGICFSEEHGATLQGLLNCCSHYFCFTCILEWSKAESRCPLCKRRFNTITVADVRSGLRNTAIRVEKRDQVALLIITKLHILMALRLVSVTHTLTFGLVTH